MVHQQSTPPGGSSRTHPATDGSRPPPCEGLHCDDDDDAGVLDVQRQRGRHTDNGASVLDVQRQRGRHTDNGASVLDVQRQRGRHTDNGAGGLEAAADVDEEVMKAGAEAERTGPRPGSGFRYSFGATLAALFTAGFIHYYCHQGGVTATPAPGSPMPGPPPRRLKGIAGPFDVELEKAELCEKDKQGVGAAKMDWGRIVKDKDVPKRYQISGRGSFNYNTSDDLASKFLLASWTFPGRWITYYSNTFSGGCSMAKNFSPEKWRRVSLLLFGHENADCPFPPIRVSVSNFTVENKQGVVKEFIYGRWKVENQIIDTAANKRVVSCGRAIFRVVPKKEHPMPAVIPTFDNSDKVSIELMEPPDAPS